MATMYYNPRTPSSGSGDPLRPHIEVRSLLRTGWGPRGDSGSARGRVRATQPASFLFCFPQFFRPEPTEEGLHSGPPFLLHLWVSAVQPTTDMCGDFSMCHFQINGLGETACGNLKGWLDR